MAGHYIRGLRQKFNLTQQQLAELGGISLHTVRQWEGGRRQPRLKTLTRLLQKLDIPDPSQVAAEWVLSHTMPAESHGEHHFLDIKREIKALRTEIALLRQEINHSKRLDVEGWDMSN